MGKLPGSVLEVRLAATLFLLLLGLADLLGAWQVKNYAGFSPQSVAATVAPEVHEMGPHQEMGMEMPIDISALNVPRHRIDRELLVQDSHVHVPVYAITSALLALVIFGLRLSSSVRVGLVFAGFAAPALDFAGLWGAHLWSASGKFWGAVAVGGGFLMGLVYLIVLVLTIVQCWFRRQGEQYA
jgi:hypothetical protein